MNGRLAAALLFLSTLGSLSSCEDTPPTIPLSIAGNPFTVELARTNAEKARGLMERNRLPENHGMLFVYEADQRMSFWMKNTRIPLSIAFISKDGVIREIREMEPFSLKTIESRQAVRYALEVPAGNFERLGIKPGDRVEFPEGFPAGGR